jgi:GMP synthase (glutamine-hydrolysing)
MQENLLKGGIAVLDFGGQYSHLICRRVRALGVYAALLPFDTPFEELVRLGVAGVILSGGPASVYEPGSPRPDGRVLSGEIPLLGICYGYQLIVQAHGGEVRKSEKREYGRSRLRVLESSTLFEGIGQESIACWMSHTDSATRLPGELLVLGASENSPYAAVGTRDGRTYGVQFHPEVAHTEKGELILANFIRACGAARNWRMEDFLERTVELLSRTLEGRVLCGVSGGVDSTVTSAILNRAVPGKLQCVFVETGLLREGEVEQAVSVLRDELRLPVDLVDASHEFLDGLRGVSDPEEKRRVVGSIFASVFERYAKEKGPFRYLAQGTLYPDVVESGRSGSHSSVIKTHHNVGGLPRGISLEVVEPLRDLYKDEVRYIGSLLGLPRSITHRHPFPGPGLAVRVIGEVTPEKLEICRKANRILEEVLVSEGLYGEVWQALAYVGDDKVTGVLGDERRVGYQVTVKVVESVDAMTADWYRLAPEVMERISARITNEVDGVVSVAYSISSKPPATIEPQ